MIEGFEFTRAWVPVGLIAQTLANSRDSRLTWRTALDGRLCGTLWRLRIPVLRRLAAYSRYRARFAPRDANACFQTVFPSCNRSTFPRDPGQQAHRHSLDSVAPGIKRCEGPQEKKNRRANPPHGPISYLTLSRALC